MTCPSRFACVAILATLSAPAAWADQPPVLGGLGGQSPRTADLREIPSDPNNPYKIYNKVEDVSGARGQAVQLKAARLSGVPGLVLSADYINFKINGKHVGTAKMPAPGVMAVLPWTVPADMSLGNHVISVEDPYYLPPGKGRLTVVPNRTAGSL